MSITITPPEADGLTAPPRKKNRTRPARPSVPPPPQAFSVPQALLAAEHDLMHRYLGETQNDIFDSAAISGDPEIVKAAFSNLFDRRRAVRGWRKRRVRDIMRLKPKIGDWVDMLPEAQQMKIRKGAVALHEIDGDFYLSDYKRNQARARLDTLEREALTVALNLAVCDASPSSPHRLFPSAVIIRADGVIQLWHDGKRAIENARATGRRFFVLPIAVDGICTAGGNA